MVLIRPQKHLCGMFTLQWAELRWPLVFDFPTMVPKAIEFGEIEIQNISVLQVINIGMIYPPNGCIERLFSVSGVRVGFVRNERQRGQPVSDATPSPITRELELAYKEFEYRRHRGAPKAFLPRTLSFQYFLFAFFALFAHLS